MLRLLPLLLAMVCAAALPGDEPPAAPVAEAAPAPAAPELPPEPVLSAAPKGVYVIPVRDQIADPILFIIRRGLKEAAEKGVELVVLDMDTPGGALDATLKIMEALDRFPGRTATFINKEAISAGAFIAAVTDDIIFRPDGVIGAAAPVMSTGQEIDPSMKQKIVSYLRARVRAASEGKGTYRGQVISAMIDADYELKIGETVIKPKGELLSLTATEAAKTYGDPPQPLLSAGTHESLESLLDARFGADRYSIVRFEVTWSERLAQYLTNISPVLMGLGLLLLFIEFKTPGFGVFGIGGLALLAVVFLSSSVAGLAGHEPMLVFGLGVLLVAAEIFFFPGLVVPAVLGVGLMLGSLVWALADVWPSTPGAPMVWSADVFLAPLGNVALALAIAMAGAMLLARLLPRSLFWDRLVLRAAVAGDAQGAPVALAAAPAGLPEPGARGRAVTDLFPSGEVEIGGRRFPARLDLGFADAGTEVVVTGRNTFGLIVTKASS